jgi:hypothetical protein
VPLLLVLSVLFIAAGTVPCAADELVTNGTFKTNVNGWVATNRAHVTWSAEDVAGASNSGSIKVAPLPETSAQGAAVQEFELVRGAQYTFKGSINNRTTIDGFFGIVTEIELELDNGSNSGSFDSINMGSGSANSTWQTFTTTFTVPFDLTHATLRLFVADGSSSNPGYVLFDEIHLIGPSPTPAPQILSFAPSPTTITPPQSSTLSWSTQDATSVTIDNGVGARPTNGSISVSPTVTTTYTLTATGPGGTSTKQATVTVQQPPPAITFTATPPSITAGESSTLSWSVTDATSVAIDHGLGSQPVTGSVSVSPSATTTYTLTATGPGGTRTAQVTVTVQAQPLPQITFRAAPQVIGEGGSSTLTWSTANATAVTIDHGLGSRPLTGSTSVSPQVTTTYRLTATGPGGTRSDQATVTVATAPVIMFTADPTTILAGQSTTLRWEVMGATTVVIDNNLGAQPSSGTVVVSPHTTTIYMLMATGPGGTRVSQVTIEVLQGRRRSVRH